MYICLCNAISDKTIRNAVHQQHIRSIRELRNLVPIGSDCGKCIRQAREIMNEEIASLLPINNVA
ncbi:bacterioferritin-associated ferredoxin [Xenorhabdus nematophila]|uniref:Bacterioferritin-associated ferredoxin n=1 Tax=Xenorhabdus nematophila (strain ATCC 19061 / DSM 3370 / CCUG 14189 / LMG 1036 / NCIMB 9965 / AN6) TaxID=406817 RepID=D3VHQ7_XENNA|nr:bacterioferritin-associated ferredoxin [Xenorhabdus nematophila]CEE89906.1 regulatory or redox component complexing with Bfr, in iron storage and mobility [Xenorhabdus nematophila str. Anatoliense]CEF30913.1 regulatory or redox component complexing with Bfr, in iron storage and mobility [Xenorhabdus nematophila str. Websteri]AYA41466.1 bacterioferritin-associated ferredoxin [Xenorhabdus nematophila]MBA0020205.1 bacterioferritin-associated ferredoxin [Xenorhabdus nematophila]MCB4427082.1 bac